MIDKLNIPLQNKDTKKIEYNLWLDEGYWDKYEYNSRGNQIYFEDSNDFWCKKEYDSRGKQIYYEDKNDYWFKKEYDNEGKRVYYENSSGYIKDDR